MDLKKIGNCIAKRKDLSYTQKNLAEKLNKNYENKLIEEIILYSKLEIKKVISSVIYLIVLIMFVLSIIIFVKI